MADAALNLTATFDDKASNKVRSLQKNLESVRRVPGMDAASQWAEEFATKTGKLVTMSGGLATVFERMGVGGLAAGASLAALVGQFKALAEHTLVLKEMARETGLTIDELNRFSLAGGKFGVSAEAMSGAVESLVAQMPQFRAGFGKLHDELAQRFPDLTKKLGLEGTKAQLLEILTFLGQAKLQADPQKQKQLAELFFPGHGGDIEKLYGQGGLGPLQKQLEEMDKRVNPIPPAVEAQAQALRNAVSDFNVSLTNLETKAAPGFLGAMTKLVTEADHLIGTVDRLADKFYNSDFAKAGRAMDQKPEVKAVQDKTAEAASNVGSAIWRFLTGGDILPHHPHPSAPVPAPAPIPTPNAPPIPTPAAPDAKPSEGGFAEWWHSLFHKDAAPKAPPPDTAGLIHKSSFVPGAEGAGLLQNASLITGAGATGDPVEIVKLGVLGAFREWQQESEALARAKDGGGAGGGIINASYETGGGGGGGGGGHGGGGRDDGSGPTPDGIATANKALPKEARALLDDIGSGEAHGYNIVNGGGRFGDYSHHPYAGMSTYRGGRAAGRYQDLPSTWARIARATGLHDFSPESQDKGNWWLAQQDYHARTHRDLLADLRSHNPAIIAGIGRALHSTWVSTNGGFARKYQHYLDRQDANVADRPPTYGEHRGAAPPRLTNIKPLPGEKPVSLPPLDSKPSSRDQEARADPARVHIEVHDRGGNVRSVRLEGGGGFITHKLHTWPGMTEPSDVG